jgi:hypothetical protein
MEGDIMSGFQKKVITWIEADRAVLRLANYILALARAELRDTQIFKPFERAYPVEGEEISVERGFVSDDPEDSWWTVDPGEIEGNTRGIGTRTPYEKSNQPSAVCWWSFQNLVRLRLMQARQEVADACLKSDKPRITIGHQSTRSILKQRAK